MNIRVAITNPISNATIREYQFVTIQELNEFLEYVAKVRCYGYRIINTANGDYYFKRERAEWVKRTLKAA